MGESDPGLLAARRLMLEAEARRRHALGELMERIGNGLDVPDDDPIWDDLADAEADMAEAARAASTRTPRVGAPRR